MGLVGLQKTQVRYFLFGLIINFTAADVVKGLESMISNHLISHRCTQVSCEKAILYFQMARWFPLEIFLFCLTYLTGFTQNKLHNLGGSAKKRYPCSHAFSRQIFWSGPIRWIFFCSKLHSNVWLIIGLACGIFSSPEQKAHR